MVEKSRQTAKLDGNTTGMLIRIYVFGPLTIEWVQERVPFPKERLSGRGAAPALALLRALISQPHRFAHRDWLMEQFWPDSQQSRAEERLDDVASGLRTLLRPPGNQTKILHYVYGTRSSGSGYRLEGYPSIWVDADAFCWYVEQAALLDRLGKPSLAYWEQAYQLAVRGEFLVEDPYCDWAKTRREMVAGQIRQCIHRLTALLRGAGAKEEALLRLRTYWHAHPTDEDVLRPLLELLGEQGRYQEAEEDYQQLLKELAKGGPDEEGHPRQPDARTRDIRAYLQIKHIPHSTTFHQPDPPSSILASDQPIEMCLPLASPRSQRTEMMAGQGEEELVPDLGIALAQGISALGPLLDQGWSAEAVAETVRVIAPVVKTLPAGVRFSFSQAGTATLSGRFALVHKKHVTEEERLQLGQAFTHGIEGGQLLLRQLRTSQCLAVSQSLLTFLEQTHTCFLDRERAFLFTALFNLIGMAFLHQKAHQKAFKALHSGYLSALGAGDAIGIVSNLLCQANAHYDLGHYQRGIEIIQQALRTLDAAEGSTVLITKAHSFGVWADCAMTAGKFEEAYQQLNAIESLLEEIPSNEEFDVINWYQLAGKCAGLMGDFATSERLCRQGLQQLPQPWNVRHLILLMPLFATSVSMRDLEASLALLEQLTLIIPQLDAPFLRQPLTQVAQGMLMAFPQEQSVKTRVAAFLQTMH